jgi:hypothetical protein
MYDWQLEPMGYTWKEFVDKVRYLVPSVAGGEEIRERLKSPRFEVKNSVF